MSVADLPDDGTADQWADQPYEASADCVDLTTLWREAHDISMNARNQDELQPAIDLFRWLGAE